MKSTFLLLRTHFNLGRPQPCDSLLGLRHCQVKAKENVTYHILQIVDRWAYMALTLRVLLDVFPPLVLLTVGKSCMALLALTDFRLRLGNHLYS